MLGGISIDESRRRSLELLCELNQPISGSPSLYNKLEPGALQQVYKQPYKEKKLLEYHRHLNSYIDANLIQIALCCEDVSLLQEIIALGKPFEDIYPMIDTN